MKNPMTLEQQHQAIDDSDAGYDMQRRPLFGPHSNKYWKDRIGEGTGLNFLDYEYRRKPKLIERFENIYNDNLIGSLHASVELAIQHRGENFIRCIRLVEDPNWVEPVPAMPPKNPWRPLAKECEWPECKPGGYILLRRNKDSGSTEWKYEEDE